MLYWDLPNQMDTAWRTAWEARYEQGNKKEHPVRALCGAAHCPCDVDALGQPDGFSRPRMELPAQWDLCLSVWRVGPVYPLSHRADPRAALSADDRCADDAVAAAALRQVLH